MKRIRALIMSCMLIAGMIPSLAEESPPSEGIQDIQLDELFSELSSWFSDTAEELGEAAEEAGSSIQTEIESHMDELDSWIEDISQDVGKSAEEAGSNIESQALSWLEKFEGWLGNTAEDVQKVAEEAAGWAEEKWTSVRGTAQEAAEWLKSRAAEWGESAQSAAQAAMQWAEANWKSLMSLISEKSGTIQIRINEFWNSMKDSVSRLYENIGEFWSGLKEDRELYSEVISGVTNVSIRESLLEYAALIEDLAAEHGTAVPDAIQEQLNALRQYAMGETEIDVKLDDEALEAWLAELGISKDELETMFKERFEKRLTSLEIQAESAAISEYMAQHGLSFSSAAKRAQDRLDRYAAGTLEMTEEQYKQAKDIIEAWCKENGIDEKTVIQLFMNYMENPAQ